MYWNQPERHILISVTSQKRLRQLRSLKFTISIPHHHWKIQKEKCNIKNVSKLPISFFHRNNHQRASFNERYNNSSNPTSQCTQKKNKITNNIELSFTMQTIKLCSNIKNPYFTEKPLERVNEQALNWFDWVDITPEDILRCTFIKRNCLITRHGNLVSSRLETSKALSKHQVLP